MNSLSKVTQYVFMGIPSKHFNKAQFILTGLLYLFTLTFAQATHLRAADIKVEPVCNSNGLTFKITVVAYLNSTSNTRFGTNSSVIFGDGESEKIPITTSTPRPDLGKNISIATFTTIHTYGSHGTYNITYIERDRSASVLNIANSHDVPYVTFVKITTATSGCNNYPLLAVPPLDRACLGATFFHSPGAYDVDGDSLSYELSIPASSPTTLAAYTAPNASKFYTNFNQGNEDKTGPPIFNINPTTGLMTWDSPGVIGEYNIAFKIIEWRRDSLTDIYSIWSTTTRDMQIIVEECQNIRPELIVPRDTCVIAGAYIKGLIKGMDEENDPVKIEVFSETVAFATNKKPAIYSPRPAAFVPSSPPAEVNFEWTTDCIHVRQQPYQVVFKITDDPPKGPKLVNFKIWNIKVLAPAPVWKPQVLDLVKRQTVLNWDNYGCANATKMQVWRKVGSYPTSLGQCDIGKPSYWGYKLIAEIPITQTSFTDTNLGKGLSVGAQYCYRLIASINDTKSIASEELCVGPIQADAPVITHVSVETTAEDGTIRVSWRSPFNINKTQFPPPYEYEVFRANGFIGDTSIIKAGRVLDTTFLDTGINTESKVFNYRIVLYAKPQLAMNIVSVDTSAAASSVWLKAKPGKNKIELSWRDSVAWSNVIADNPWHLIYRGEENTLPNKMVLIDSVDVTENGFTYVDKGRYKNIPIAEDKFYTYRVLTRGTYGNPKIKRQENFSQMVLQYPENKLLPCQPIAVARLVNCEDYINANTCDQTEFSNTLTWGSSTDIACRKDIKSYNVYASFTRDGEYQLLASHVKDTFLLDTGLSSYARCYKVAAIDALGQVSLMSASVCNDNCPYYQLPNVFTPNTDGFNDFFTARFKQLDTSAEIPCPRFAKAIDFKVFNRWGKEVYRYSSETNEGIRLAWDGNDSSGSPLSTGVYYYAAEVTFNMLDPEEQNKRFTGWVHLVR